MILFFEQLKNGTPSTDEVPFKVPSNESVPYFYGSSLSFARRELGDVDLHLTSSSRRVAANNLYRSVGFQQRETNVYNLEIRSSTTDLVARLREFIENEGRSCSMDLACITPEYVYRMWGGKVPLEEIEKGLKVLKNEG